MQNAGEPERPGSDAAGAPESNAGGSPRSESAGSGAVGPRRSARPLWLIVIAAVIALVAGFAGGFVSRWVAPDRDASAAAGTGSVCNSVSVADRTLPAVVTISAAGSGGSGTGTGEIIKSDGYILTNNHVISVGADGGEFHVLYSNGDTVSATLVGRDPKSDLAVLKVSKSGLPTVPIGDSTGLRVGQPVVALGAPLGLSGTVTSGIVSALGRTVPVPSDNGSTALLTGAIQTDAAINPGNSGGPLVDCSGRLIGVNTAIATVPNEAGQSGGGSVGIGFAVPVNLAMSVADQLISKGHASYPYFGVSVTPIPASVAQRWGITDGLYVQSVVSGGPMDEAGIKEGDVIVDIGGQAATSPDVLTHATIVHQAGDQVSVTYVRDGASKTVHVTLAPAPAPTPAQGTSGTSTVH
jgi:putative serine protease PepD